MSARHCTAFAYDPVSRQSVSPLRPCGAPATHMSTATLRQGVTVHPETRAQYPLTAPRCTPCVERITPTLATLSVTDVVLTPIAAQVQS